MRKIEDIFSFTDYLSVRAIPDFLQLPCIALISIDYIYIYIY